MVPPFDLAQSSAPSGVTRNVSASGVFLETDVDYALGDEISVAIEIDGLRGEKIMSKRKGQVVRVEHRDGKAGLAVKTVASTLESNG